MALADRVADAVAAWDMDEASGTRADQVSSNDLTDMSSVGSTTGQFGNAADFVAASGDFLELGDNADVSTGDITFQLSGWFNITSASTFRYVFSKAVVNGAAGLQEYGCYFDPGDSRLKGFVSDGANFTTAGAGGPALSTGVTYPWRVYHDATNNVVGVQVGNNAKDEVSHTTGVQDSTGTFRIGASGSSDLFFDGWIDDVVFLKGAIFSDDEWTEFIAGAEFPWPAADLALVKLYIRSYRPRPFCPAMERTKFSITGGPLN